MTSPTRQIAFLRGINVGRNNRVAMAQLRTLLLDLGYTDVVTHLQSGNAVFSSALAPAVTGAAIEQALVTVLGVKASVVVRTHADLASAVQTDPLRAVATDPAKHLLGFLSAAPAVERLQRLDGLITTDGADSDQFRLVGDHLYLWCPRGVLDSLFSKVDWERYLGVSVTMRNWNTVTRLIELSGT